ncbi:hypothetical protein KFU94_61210 [Chloroflexi bacterium TSY]|nr:hypothetical protein [Chloroflexi bacterium TSY]
MPHWKLQLLDPPLLERNGIPVDVGRRKAVALLAYLATTGQSHSRDSLAALFWPEYDHSTARTDLRRTLSVLNKTLGPGVLATNRKIVRLAEAANPAVSSEQTLWFDVAEFRRCLTACQSHDHPPDQVCDDCLPLLDSAVTLYRGDFLAGFTLRDSAEFDDWQYFESENLRHALATALERLVQGHGARSEFEQAVNYARRWLALDPLNEPVHRHLMQLFAWSNQPASARRQYNQCRQILCEELGVPPSAETTELDAAIQAGRLRPPETGMLVQGHKTQDATHITDSQATARPPAEKESHHTSLFSGHCRKRIHVGRYSRTDHRPFSVR